MDPTNWLPFYPDLPERVKPRLEPALASQPPYNTGIFPVPDILAGLTFLPHFPDQVPHVVEPREQMIVTTGAIFTTAIAPTDWLPIYPDLVPRPQLPVAAMPTVGEAPPGYQMVVAQSLTWNADYPDRTPFLLSLEPDGAFYTIPPAVAASTIVCTELVDEALGTPILRAAALTTPGAITEGLGTPRLIYEALC